MPTRVFLAPSEKLKKFNFSKEELAEEFSHGGEGGSLYYYTGYPQPDARLRLIIESAHASIEEMYYWILEHLRTDFSFGVVDKITDVFTASEQSAFWGQSQQRLGIQQDRVQNYMVSIGKMVKDLFAIVRELRIIDEKLEPRIIWNEAARAVKEGKPATSVPGVKAADSTLKSEFTDLVENRGGQIQPGSIYHLAQRVGYATLPDLFFNTKVFDIKSIDKVVDGLDFNPNVKNVLRRKLMQFVNWKLKSDHELEQRRRFQIRYLRQHWDTIKMYMSWVKPYLRNVKRLSMNPQFSESPDLVAAFEGALTEIELLARQKPIKGVYPCIVATFLHRTRPHMDFHREGFQHRGPVHVGRVELTLRAYSWTEEDIKNYKAYREAEEMDLLELVDESVKSAMDALSDDLEKYLEGLGAPDKLTKKPTPVNAATTTKKRAPPGALDPFLAIFKGFGELFSPFAPIHRKEKQPARTKPDAKAAKKTAVITIYQVYKNYKKSHRLLSW
ncbi:hypothetical protein D6783_03995 [Candidatus Woesearchaeota archaeon]|nr:MAG: hypothetical protein D6783_03995 [Candidatus Woesearchaeota archaeon]